MDTLKRGRLYLAHNFGRSLLLFAVFTVLAFSMIIGVSVIRSAGEADADIRRRLGTSIVFTFAPKPATGLEDAGDSRSEQEMDGVLNYGKRAETILSVPGIAAHNYEYTNYAYFEDLELRGGLFEKCEKLAQADPLHYMGGDPYEFDQLKLNRKVTQLTGCLNSNMLDYFRLGSFSVVRGRPITEADRGVCLVSESLAQRNNLDLGHFVSVSATESMMAAYPEKGEVFKKVVGPIKLEIVGIFSVNAFQPANEHTAESDIAENLIFSDLASSQAFAFPIEGQTFPVDKTTYFVEDPVMLEDVLSKVKSVEGINSAEYLLKPNDVDYLSSVKPLRSMKTLAAWLVALIAGGCMVVLALLIFMWTKRRQREIGIYRALGISKGRIYGQMLFETLSVLCLAVVVATVVAIVFVSPVGNRLLSSFTKEVTPDTEITEEMVRESITNDTFADLFQIEAPSQTPNRLSFAVRPPDIFFPFAIAAIVVILSVSAALWKMRKKPVRQLLLGG